MIANKTTIMARLAFTKLAKKKNQISFRKELDFKKRLRLKEELKALDMVENILNNQALVAKD